MGIITKKVKMKPTGILRTHLKERGYTVPNKYSEVEIDIDDLPIHSEAIIECICDDCGKLFNLKWKNYTCGQMIKYDGKTFCEHCINKGERNYLWNPNISQEEREQKRNYPEYAEFVKRVLNRDNFTCQRCGTHNNNMEVHHLDGYNWCIEKRIDDTNGITLCHECHDEFHCIYGKKNNTKEQFEEWINKEVSLDVYSGEIHKIPKIYCLEDDIIYDNVIEAGKMIGCYPYSIYDVCKGRVKTLFKKHYVFYYDYLNGNIPDYCYDFYRKPYTRKKQIESKYNIPKHKIDLKKEPLITLCLNDGVIYDFTESKEPPYNIKYLSELYRTCNGRRLHCGQLNGKYFDWCWLIDFQQLSPQDQLQIALDNKETLKEGSFLYELLYNNDNNKDNDKKEHLSSHSSQTLLQPSAQ